LLRQLPQCKALRDKLKTASSWDRENVRGYRGRWDTRGMGRLQSLTFDPVLIPLGSEALVGSPRRLCYLGLLWSSGCARRTCRSAARRYIGECSSHAGQRHAKTKYAMKSSSRRHSGHQVLSCPSKAHPVAYRCKTYCPHFHRCTHSVQCRGPMAEAVRARVVIFAAVDPTAYLSTAPIQHEQWERQVAA
jgi:hypothetical protein